MIIDNNCEHQIIIDILEKKANLHVDHVVSVDCYGMPQAILRTLVAQQELVGDADNARVIANGVDRVMFD